VNSRDEGILFRWNEFLRLTASACLRASCRLLEVSSPVRNSGSQDGRGRASVNRRTARWRIGHFPKEGEHWSNRLAGRGPRPCLVFSPYGFRPVPHPVPTPLPPWAARSRVVWFCSASGHYDLHWPQATESCHPPCKGPVVGSDDKPFTTRSRIEAPGCSELRLGLSAYAGDRRAPEAPGP
jgi:hypothetical protein